MWQGRVTFQCWRDSAGTSTLRDYTVALTHKLAEAGLELLLKLLRVSLIARDLNLLLLQKSMLLEKPELITLTLGGAAIELSLEQ